MSVPQFITGDEVIFSNGNEKVLGTILKIKYSYYDNMYQYDIGIGKIRYMEDAKEIVTLPENRIVKA